MSRKEKLAAEYADDNASNGFTKFVLLKGFLAGYAACEQDAKGLVEKIESIAWINKCKCDVAYSSRKKHEPNALCGELDELLEELANWKERGE